MSPAHRGDDRAATAAALLAGGLVGQQVAGKAIRDALFLSAFRVSSLPGMMMLSAIASAAAALLFARAMGRRSPSRVMSLGLASAAALFVGEWWLALSHTRAAAVAVYLHLALFGPALVSGLWSLVNERFDPHAAKGLVGRVGAGASVGAVAGGLMTWLAAGRMSVPTMLVGLAAVSAASLLGLRWLRMPVGERERPPAAQTGLASPASGVRALREFPYLRHLAFLVGLASFTEILIDYVFKAEAVGRLSGSGQLIGFFGPFYTGLAGLALVVQGLFSRACLERLGLAGTIALHPLATAAGSALALLKPGLASAVVARGSNGILRDSLFRSGYELLYTPLPPQRKRATKAVIDVAADKVGAIAGAAVAMLLVAATPSGDRALLALALVGSVAALAVARWLHQGYVASLRESLRAGIVHVDLSDAVDVTTRTTLTESLDRQSVLSQIEALRGGSSADSPDEPREPDPLVRTIADLRSSRADRIRHAIRKAPPGEPRLVPHLLPLLERNDVLSDVLRYLRGCLPKCTGQVLDALLDPDSSAAVRRRVPRVLKACPTQRAVNGLLQGLDDPAFAVRAECGLVLSHLKARGPELRIPGEAAFPRVVRELASMEEGERSLEHAFTLLGLVLEREPLLISFRALRGEDRRLRGTALEYLDNVLPDAVRQRLWPRIGPEAPRAAPARPRGEVESELLQSVSGLSRSRLGLKPPRRE